MEALRSVLAKHPAHVSAAPDRGSIHLRYRFRHLADAQRIFDLAVLMFAVVGK